MSKVEMSGFMGGRGAMEPERIALNQRERERLKVLYEVKQKHLTQVEAAERLKVSERTGCIGWFECGLIPGHDIFRLLESALLKYFGNSSEGLSPALFS